MNPDEQGALMGLVQWATSLSGSAVIVLVVWGLIKGDPWLYTRGYVKALREELDKAERSEQFYRDMTLRLLEANQEAQRQQRRMVASTEQATHLVERVVERATNGGSEPKASW